MAWSHGPSKIEINGTVITGALFDSFFHRSESSAADIARVETSSAFAVGSMFGLPVMTSPYVPPWQVVFMKLPNEETVVLQSPQSIDLSYEILQTDFTNAQPTLDAAVDDDVDRALRISRAAVDLARESGLSVSEAVRVVGDMLASLPAALGRNRPTFDQLADALGGSRQDASPVDRPKRAIALEGLGR